MSDEHKSLQQIIDFRLEKLNKLREDGVNVSYLNGKRWEIHKSTYHFRNAE